MPNISKYFQSGAAKAVQVERPAASTMTSADRYRQYQQEQEAERQALESAAKLLRPALLEVGRGPVDPVSFLKQLERESADKLLPARLAVGRPVDTVKKPWWRTASATTPSSRRMVQQAETAWALDQTRKELEEAQRDADRYSVVWDVSPYSEEEQAAMDARNAEARARVSRLEDRERQLVQQQYHQERNWRIWEAENAGRTGKDVQALAEWAVQEGKIPNDGKYRNLAIAMMMMRGSPKDTGEFLKRLLEVHLRVGPGGSSAMLDVPALKWMTGQQKQTLAYLVGLGDYDRASQYLEDISWELNAQEAEQFNTTVTQFAKEHPALGTAANVISWPLALSAYYKTGEQAVRDLGTRITGGEQEPLDYNSSWFTGTRLGARTSEGVQGAAREAATNAFGSEKAGDAAAFLAGTGLSIGQNVTQIAALAPLGPAAPLVGMALSAAGSASYDALERGATAGEAFAIGTGAGAIEALTEYVSLDNLIELSGGYGGKQLAKDVLKQAGIEASEEAASEILNNVWDTAVLRGSSEYRRYVTALIDEGLSPEEAEKRAFIQFYEKNVAAAALGGALSGGVMGAGGAVMGRYSHDGRTGRNLQDIDGAYQAIQDNGLFAPENRSAMERARNSGEALRQQEGRMAARDIRRDGLKPGQNVTAEEFARDGQVWTPKDWSAPADGQGQTGTQADGQQKTAVPMEETADRSLVQKIGDAIPQMRNQTSVIEVTGNEIPGDGKLIDCLVRFASAIGNKVNRPGFGDVLFSRSRIKNSMLGHGMGRTKIDLFAAVPSVIQNGTQIDHQENWKGRGYDTYTFAAPVTYKGERTYLGVIVTKDHQDGRYYVHEVVDENGSLIFAEDKNTEAASDGRATLPGTFDTVATSGLSENSQDTEYYNADSNADPAHNARSVPPQSSSENSIAQAGQNVKPVELEWTGLDRETARTLKAMSRAAGTRIVRTQAVEGVGSVQGWYQDGTIYITENADRPVLEVAKHEVTHRLQQYAPAEYQRYRDYVEQILEQRGGLDEKIATVQGVYENEMGQILDRDGALDELAADFTRELLLNEDTFRELVRKDRSVARRMLDWLKELLSRVTGVFSKEHGVQAEDLERAARLWEHALRETYNSRSGQDGTGGAQTDGGSKRYSIVQMEDGRKFVRADRSVIYGNDPESWREQLQDYIDGKIRRGGNVQLIAEDGEVLTLTADTAGKISSPYTGKGTTIPEETYYTKVNAGAHIDELAQVSRSQGKSKVDTDGRHGDFASRGWDYRTAYFQDFDGKYYWVGISVAKGPDGNVVYNIGEIRERSLPTVDGSSAKGGALNGGKTSSAGTITQQGGDVKGQSGDIRERSLPNTTDLTAKGSSAKGGAQGVGKTSSAGTITQQGGDVKGQSTERDGLVTLPDARKGETEVTLPDFRKKDGGEKQYSVQGAVELQDQISDLQKQKRRLEEKVEWLKGQMRHSRGVSDVARVSREVLEDFSSKYDKNTLTKRLQTLYDAMDSYGTPRQTMTQAEWQKEARSIAQDVLEESSQLNDELYQEHKELRSYLRNTKIQVPRSLWGELESQGGYNEFRKRNMGRMKLSSTDGIAIEQAYQELSYDYPGLFNEEAVSHPADQLLQMAKVLDSLRPYAENPYAGDSGAVDYLAGELIERFFDLPQNKPTFADRQAKKLDNERAQAKERMQRALEKQAAKNARTLEKIAEASKKERTLRDERELRSAIERHAGGLSRKLLKPTDKSHIPDGIREHVVNLLEAINLESKYAYSESGKRFKRVDDTSPARHTDRTVAAQRLAQMYEDLKKSEGFSSDPDLPDNFRAVAQMGNIRVADMNKDQLLTVWRAIRAVERSVTLADKLLGKSRYAYVSQMAQALDGETRGRKDRANLVGALGVGDRLLNLDMLTPETYFHRLGEPGDELHRMMRGAQDRQVWILDEGIEAFQKAVKETGVDMHKAEKEVHDFKLADGHLQLTTAQIMSLYALSKRTQAMDHIYEGGIKAADGKKGLKELSRATPVHVTWEDVADITGKLTDKQKQFVDTLQGYLSGKLAEHGNEASMEAYGYKKFTEEHYWPIKVDKNQTHTDEAKEAKARTIPEFGMTKNTTPHANNAVVLRSALDVFGEHLNQMAVYSAWLSTAENINKVHNYTFWADGKRTGTVKAIFEQVYGKGGNEYLTKLMQDVALGTKVGSESTPADVMLNKFKAAKVGANLRVILQQPTAIIRAMELLDPKYFATPRNPMKGWKTATEHCAIAKWKDWGYFELDIGRSLWELLAGTDSMVEKVKNASMWGAGMGDSVAWGHLWNAVEAETADRHKELKRGSKEFYEQCAQRFGEIIDRTQVVDSVMHRTQIMRSSSYANRMATSFMSEPSKIYNMAMRDIYDIRTAEKGSEARKQAGKHLARTGAALTVSFAVNAIMQSIMDAFRDDDRDKKYWEKFGEAWVENFWENYDPLGYLPYIKDAESIIQGYDVSRSDMEGIADLWSAIQQFVKIANGESKYTAVYGGVDLAARALDAFGLPGYNLKRDAVAIASTFMLGTGMYEAVYEADKRMLDITSDKNRGFYCDNLYRVMKEDWDAYETIYADMVKCGMDPDSIASAMEDRMAKEAGLDSTRMLPVDFAPPGEDPEYDALMQAKDGWLEQWGEDGHELAQRVDALEPEEDKDQVSNLQRIWTIAESPYEESVKELALERVFSENDYQRYQAARDAGVSTLEYTRLYDAFRKAKFERTGKNGAPSQEDVLGVLDGWKLTRAQKTAIWDSYGWKAESPWG